MKRRRSYNTKRRLAALKEASAIPPSWRDASYGGNPEHKTRPGDYDLAPPTSPRPGKTLCDAGREFPKQSAEALLRIGFARQMVSVQQHGDWPQNVWAVNGDAEAFEAQLENRERGVYHGYPMPRDDPFRDIVLKEWLDRVR